MEGFEVANDHVFGAFEVYLRVRAFFHTTSYVCIADPSMLDYLTALYASEYSAHLSGEVPPPAQFFVYAWAQTSHALAEHMRMEPTPSSKR